MVGLGDRVWIRVRFHVLYGLGLFPSATGQGLGVQVRVRDQWFYSLGLGQGYSLGVWGLVNWAQGLGGLGLELNVLGLGLGLRIRVQCQGVWMCF